MKLNTKLVAVMIACLLVAAPATLAAPTLPADYVLTLTR